MKKVLAVALGALLAVSMIGGGSGGAEAKKAAKSKSCAATSTQTGKKVSWSCKAEEICCFNNAINKGSCSPKATGFCL